MPQVLVGDKSPPDLDISFTFFHGPETTEIVNVLTPAIRGGGNDVDAKQVQKWVWEAGLIEAMRCAGEIVTVALNSGQNEGNEEAEENPPHKNQEN